MQKKNHNVPIVIENKSRKKHIVTRTKINDKIHKIAW